MRAADRVKRLFSEGNQHLFYTLTSQLPTHHYDLVQIPKVPSQLRRLSLYGKQMKSPPKKQRKWNSNEKERSKALALKDRPYQRSELSPARVKLCKLKEHYLASKKLKSISSEKKSLDHLKNYQINTLDQPADGYVKDERMEYWEEMIHNREERHFNIGRIIKYLSD